MPGDMHRPLRELLGLVRQSIAELEFADSSTSATSYGALDRADQTEHLGTYVWSPATRDSGKLGGRREVLVYDTVELWLTCALPRTPGQIETMDRATEHEERLITGICSATRLQPYEPLYLDTARQVTPDKAWVRSRITLRLQRMQATRLGS